MKKVLFVAYGGGHVRMLLPVAKLLRDRALAEPVFVGLTTARREVEAAGFRCLGFSDFLEAGDEQALAKGEMLASALAVHSTSRDESAAYLGLSYADLVHLHGEAAASAMYAAHGRQCFLPVRFMERVLRSVAPDLLVATSAPRAERASVMAARNLGIPALCLVDLFAAYEIEWLRDPRYADRIGVLNESVRQRLLAAGRKADEVVVTGNPAFDPLLTDDIQARGLALRRQRGWETKSVWLWASQVEPLRHPCNPGRGDPSLPLRVARELQRITQEHPHMELVIRPHPSEREFPLQPGDREWLSPPGEDLHALLAACDGVVVLTSTVGIEARIAGCRVVQVLGSLYTPDTPYLALGIADAAVTVEQLASAVEAPPAPRRRGSENRQAAAAARVLQHIMDLW